MIELTNIENGVVVKFNRNCELQSAFDAAYAEIPNKYVNRGTVDWRLSPIDESYGDILKRGVIVATWSKQL